MTNQIKKHLDFLLNDMERSPAFYIWISVLAAMTGLAAYTILMSLIYSLEIFEFSIHIIWVTMVSNYVFLVVSSTGLCIVTSLGHVFGMQRYELVAKRGVFLALITIIFGMISIGGHLGHPERAMIFNLLTPNFLSAMWWMGTLYTFYIVFITMEYWLLARSELIERSDQAVGLERTIFSFLALKKLDASRLVAVLKNHRLLQLVGAAALISGLSAHNTLGALFGHIEARPLWYGAYYPIYFLLSASFCGFAWLLAVSIATYKIKREEIPEDYRLLIFEMAQVLALLLSVGLLFTAYKMGFGLFTPAKVKPIMLFLKGPFSLAFWLFEIAIGTILPIPILLYAAKKRNITGVLVASSMVLGGVYVMRYDFVVAAQIYPVIKNGLPSYLPTFMEVLFIGGVFGALFLTYTLGEIFLPLKEERHCHTA
jgi:molybdopterin-containing oxidoreductase family membrane subunit